MVETYVIGSGGLIGSALVRCESFVKPFPEQIQWRNAKQIGESFLKWSTEVSQARNRINIIWAAGAGRVGSSDEDLEIEIKTFKLFLDTLKTIAPTINSVTVLSSAGGVYGGSTDSPITENSVPAPISSYGTSRLAIEALATEFAMKFKVNLRIARIANVYGPGQSAAKQQGLITALVRANISRMPLELYVPIDTRRDYIFVDDAARKILSLSNLSSDEDLVILKIIASGETISIGSIVAQVTRNRGIRTPVILGQRKETFLQPLSMAFKSIRHLKIDDIELVPIEVGISAVIHEQISQAMNPK